VLRFLADDIGKELDLVLDAILRSLSNRSSRFRPATTHASGSAQLGLSEQALHESARDHP
jgi:hypothetical protein